MAEKSKFFDALALQIAAGESVSAASKTCGCAASTAYRIAAGQEFQTEVAKLRTAYVRQSVGKLSRATEQAVSTLVSLLNSSDETIQLRAANSILDKFASMSENLELNERIEALESQNNGKP